MIGIVDGVSIDHENDHPSPKREDIILDSNMALEALIDELEIINNESQ